jgi:hypothetical protein
VHIGPFVPPPDPNVPINNGDPGPAPIPDPVPDPVPDADPAAADPAMPGDDVAGDPQ